MRVRNKAFTLIEVLITISLVGVILSGALAPLVLMVDNLQQVEREFSDSTALHKTVSIIFRDIRTLCFCPRNVSTILKRRDLPGNKRRDLFLYWTCDPAGYQRGVGTMVYGITEGSWGQNRSPRLFRWFLPSVIPEEVIVDNLKDDSPHAQLLLPGVSDISFSAWDGTAWTDTYQGGAPAAVRITIKRGEQEMTYLEWIPR